jgi:hypothetical protein
MAMGKTSCRELAEQDRRAIRSGQMKYKAMIKVVIGRGDMGFLRFAHAIVHGHIVTNIASKCRRITTFVR